MSSQSIRRCLFPAIMQLRVNIDELDDEDIQDRADELDAAMDEYLEEQEGDEEFIYLDELAATSPCQEKFFFW